MFTELARPYCWSDRRGCTVAQTQALVGEVRPSLRCVPCRSDRRVAQQSRIGPSDRPFGRVSLNSGITAFMFSLCSPKISTLPAECQEKLCLIDDRSLDPVFALLLIAETVRHTPQMPDSARFQQVRSRMQSSASTCSGGNSPSMTRNIKVRNFLPW